jgi:H+-transporting ATPase
LKLSVAGHLTIFLTRTRGPFWSIRPARILWMAVLGTQIIATLIAVYGLFMTPLGWGWAGFVWGYALIWFLINDRIKLLAYRIFDPVKAVPALQATTVKNPQIKENSKPDTKAESKPEVKAETQPEPRSDGEDVPKAEPKSDAKPPSEVTPQLVKRVHELYEELGREDVKAVQDWEQAHHRTTPKAAPDEAHK